MCGNIGRLLAEPPANITLRNAYRVLAHYTTSQPSLFCPSVRSPPDVPWHVVVSSEAPVDARSGKRE